MSILPQYQKLGASDSDPFPIYPAKNRLSFEDDDDEVAPAYPPRQGTAGGDTSRNVTYTFEPRWPVKGTKENVLGVMGSDKDDTIAIVQRAFPILSDYPPHRIEFLAAVGNGSNEYGRILEEAWPGIISSPPGNLMVRVEDGPGDAKKRHFRVTYRPLIWTLGGLFSFFLFFGLLIWYAGGFE